MFPDKNNKEGMFNYLSLLLYQIALRYISINSSQKCNLRSKINFKFMVDPRKYQILIYSFIKNNKSFV